MHQHVEADLLLQADDPLDLRAHERAVLVGGDRTARELRAGAADLAGLRERADRGGRQLGQVERGLRRDPLLVVGAGEVALVEAREAITHGGHAHAGRAAAVGEGSGCRVELGRDGVASFDEPTRERRDLGDLLVGECEPAHEARVERGLVGDIVRHVEERRRGRHGDGTGERARRLRPVERAGQVTAPDVVPVDHAGDERLRGERLGGRRIEHLGQGAAHEVEADRLDGGRGERGQGVIERAVRGGDEDRGPRRSSAPSAS